MILALSYLWLNGRCETLGRRITQLENQKVELVRKVKLERSHWEVASAIGMIMAVTTVAVMVLYYRLLAGIDRALSP